MKNITRLKLLALLIGIGLLSAAQSASAQLTIGLAAPKLIVGKWIQGEPVTIFDTNHIYILNFWATWGAPSREAIPHLNALAEKFKDKGVIVIGQDIWDEDDAVAPFVKKMGDQMTYRIALDDKSRIVEGFMSQHWWKRGAGHGIPCAIIVNQQGRIAWIGHPMNLKEPLINDILSGHYDVDQAAATYAKDQQLLAKCNEISSRLYVALKQKQWDAAAATMDELTAADPRLKKSYGDIRFQILLGQKKYKAAYALARSLSDAQPDDNELQNSLAWTIVSQDGVEQRNLALAQKCADRAVKATNSKDPAILDTLARLQFMTGKKAEAIATEQAALSIAPEEDKDLYRKCLVNYQAGQLPEVYE